jgi:hypothetical protein
MDELLQVVVLCKGLQVTQHLQQQQQEAAGTP